MSTKPDAVTTLVNLIHTGDLEAANQWAVDHADALSAMKVPSTGALAAVANACNRWRAPIVWPWGNRPTPNAAQRRVLVAIQTGGRWHANNDTLAIILACGWATCNDGEGWRFVKMY